MSLMAISRKIAALEKRMVAAAAAEQFEEALKLRNEIAELKGQAPIWKKSPTARTGRWCGSPRRDKWGSARIFRSRRRQKAGGGPESPTQ